VIYTSIKEADLYYNQDLKKLLLADTFKSKSTELANAIADTIYSIDNGISKLGLSLADTVDTDYYVISDPILYCEIRTGLELLLTEFNQIQVYTGDDNTPQEERKQEDFYILQELFEQAITNLNRLDYFLHEICANILIDSKDIPPNTPANHWWWFEAAFVPS
jgi:hypothetical protein